MKTLAFLFYVVLVPMLVNEFTDWLPWFAARLVRAATHTLPSAARSRYAEEWLAELDAVPGDLSKLAVAIRIFVRAPATAAAISGVSSFKAMAIKALFDKMAAMWALMIVAPLLAVIALIIKITDGGPVFSRETRIGKDGQRFALLKFRTIAMGTEAPQQLAPRSGVLSLVSYNPQVTRVGNWLRRNSLDELPQLYNVLFGDMSLVGPRPALPAEMPKLGNQLGTRLAVRPGITGLCQVSGRPGLSWYEAERLNQRYVDNWSLALDLQILWKTWRAIFRDSYY